jgi:hypothetical protein
LFLLFLCYDLKQIVSEIYHQFVFRIEVLLLQQVGKRISLSFSHLLVEQIKPVPLYLSLPLGKFVPGAGGAFGFLLFDLDCSHFDQLLPLVEAHDDEGRFFGGNITDRFQFVDHLSVASLLNFLHENVFNNVCIYMLVILPTHDLIFLVDLAKSLLLGHFGERLFFSFLNGCFCNFFGLFLDLPFRLFAPALDFAGYLGDGLFADVVGCTAIHIVLEKVYVGLTLNLFEHELFGRLGIYNAFVR